MVIPELRQLRYVIEVERQRSFTRAAEHLHVAQQALSQQIKTVEDQLGVRLFDRSSRGVQPTPAGEVFVEEARRVVSAAERVVTRTQAAARGEAGTLRLAHTLSTAYETLPAIVEALRSGAPDLRVQLQEVAAADLERALRDGRQDAALAPRMTVGPGTARVEVRREPFAVAVAGDHPLADSASIALADLSDQEFQVWPREVAPGYYDAVVGACRDAGFEPRISESASGATVWGQIAAGRGVGLVVRSLAEQLPRGVTLLNLGEPAPLLIFDLLWSAEHDGPLLQQLRDAASRAGAERRWTVAH